MPQGKHHQSHGQSYHCGYGKATPAKGAVIAEGVHTGINTTIYPGRKIWPNKTTMPGEIVKSDIK
ncbi:MAG: hypothetical protein ABIH55_04505 [Nanoarchaeota archaeon]